MRRSTPSCRRSSTPSSAGSGRCFSLALTGRKSLAARAPTSQLVSALPRKFFADPVAAFANLARAARPGARLVMMVWQGHDRNEWATAIESSLTGGTSPRRAQARSGLDPFSLGDPATVESILGAAGFVDVGFTDVDEPVYYGPDAGTAQDLVRDMKMTGDLLAGLDPAATEAALARLRETLAAHETGHGVLFGSRSWIVTARRAERSSSPVEPAGRR
jgi:hypothetical protein